MKRDSTKTLWIRRQDPTGFVIEMYYTVANTAERWCHAGRLRGRGLARQCHHGCGDFVDVLLGAESTGSLVADLQRRRVWGLLCTALVCAFTFHPHHMAGQGGGGAHHGGCRHSGSKLAAVDTGMRDVLSGGVCLRWGGHRPSLRGARDVGRRRILVREPSFGVFHESGGAGAAGCVANRIRVAALHATACRPGIADHHLAPLGTRHVREPSGAVHRSGGHRQPIAGPAESTTGLLGGRDGDATTVASGIGRGADRGRRCRASVGALRQLATRGAAGIGPVPGGGR